jgi:hypothetical protein
MIRSFLFVLFLLAAPVLAETDSTIRRIFDNINFMVNQLTLDSKISQDQPPGPAQEPTRARSSGKGKTTKKTDKPEIAPSPVSRMFSAPTVWGDISVTILDYGTRMTLQVKSSVGAQGWMLQKGDSNNIIFKGNVEGNARNFQIEIPRQYSPDLGLTVIVNSTDGPNPAFLALK